MTVLLRKRENYHAWQESTISTVSAQLFKAAEPRAETRRRLRQRSQSRQELIHRQEKETMKVNIARENYYAWQESTDHS